MDFELKQHVYDILVHDFAFPEESVRLFESQSRKYREGEGAISIVNKSFVAYDEMNETEKEYLKFVTAWRIGSKVTLAKSEPRPCRTDAERILDLERSINALNQVGEMMKAFKQGMQYYIPLMQSGKIDKDKFYYKSLPEYIGKKITLVKSELEQDFGPQHEFII